MRPFPEIFDPTSLIGVRGRQFPRREDAFQQLTGDGFRELRRGLGVHVSPTRGPDGSIDVFIEPSERGDDRCLPTLPKPLIVECKDVEGGRRLRENVLAGWRRVSGRLELQAAQGWQGNYAPWRSARAYVYAVSARLPAAQLRLDLRDEIVAFFSALPGGPSLERIEVLDWSDLRALWDGAPRLADRWLGSRPPSGTEPPPPPREENAAPQPVYRKMRMSRIIKGVDLLSNHLLAFAIA
jgi:hypothetical protein